MPVGTDHPVLMRFATVLVISQGALVAPLIFTLF